MLLLLFYFCFLLRTTALGDFHPRIDCHPDPGPNQSRCEQRNCVWESSLKQGATSPQCHFPRTSGYAIVGPAANSLIKLKKIPGILPNPFGSDHKHIQIENKPVGDAIYLVIGARGALKPELTLDRTPFIQSDSRLGFKFETEPFFSFQVFREDTNLNIWDTSIGEGICTTTWSLGGIISGPQYIQLSTFIPTSRIVGFGEHSHLDLQHDLTKYTTWPMFTKDRHPNPREVNYLNLYGVHNFYVGLESDGRAHGVFVLNSHAQEVVTGPGPHLTYRAIGGVFEVFLLPGPTPEQVIQQYNQIVGNPYLPAYWALGFQFSRYGFKGVSDVERVVEKMRKAQIPLDVVYADIDYMKRFKDFTFDDSAWKEFPAYVEKLHNQSMRLTLIFDPAVEVDYESYQRGLGQGAKFISWPNPKLVPQNINNLYPLTRNSTVMLGIVWPDRHVAFPDFYDDSNATRLWWEAEFELFHKVLPFDGIWIDMNEPTNFGTTLQEQPTNHDRLFLKCPSSGLEQPPYQTYSVYYDNKDRFLCSNTLCMGAVTSGGKTMYEVKNMYGMKETVATSEVMRKVRNERSQVISRSTFPTSGHYGGHWLGDNTASWADLRSASIGVQEFNMFGITHVGSDVCGFSGPTNEELCLRWHQLGAFHSFYRNHNMNDKPDQDPTVWPSVTIATKAANEHRYSLLPFLYTLHFHSSRRGGTVVRPVFFEFPKDVEALTNSVQFMWGSVILVCPVTEPNVDYIRVYIPPDDSWYYLYSDKYGTEVAKGYTQVAAPRDTPLPNFLRAGAIIPRQFPSTTTDQTRRNPLNLLISLGSSPRQSQSQKSRGELVWDDGRTVHAPHHHAHIAFHFRATPLHATLAIAQKRRGAVRVPEVAGLELFGYWFQPHLRTFAIDGRVYDVTERSRWVREKGLLQIDIRGLPPDNRVDVLQTISWEHSETSKRLF